jgi:hypothetical protein
MTADGWPTIDHGHVGVRLGTERVGEGEPARARSHNQTIGVDQRFLPPRPRGEEPTDRRTQRKPARRTTPDTTATGDGRRTTGSRMGDARRRAGRDSLSRARGCHECGAVAGGVRAAPQPLVFVLGS